MRYPIRSKTIFLFSAIFITHLFMVLHSNSFNSDGLIFYYILKDPNLHPFYNFLIVGFITFLILDDLYVYEHSNYDAFIIQRVGFFNYTFQKIRNITKRTLCISLYSEIVVLLLIHVMKSKIHFNIPVELHYQATSLSIDLTLNLVMTVAATVLGTVVLCLFIASLSSFIHNRFFFNVLTPVVFFLCIIGFYLIIQLYSIHIYHHQLIFTLLYSLNIGNLFSVGAFSSGVPQLSVFILSTCVFSFLALVFVSLATENKKRTGLIRN